MGRLEALQDMVTSLDQEVGIAEHEAAEVGMTLQELVAQIAGLA
jgi:hypothetical protein